MKREKNEECEEVNRLVESMIMGKVMDHIIEWERKAVKMWNQWLDTKRNFLKLN